MYLLLSTLDLSLTTLSEPFDPKLVVPLYRLSKSNLSLLMILSEPFGPTLAVLLSEVFKSSYTPFIQYYCKL